VTLAGGADAAAAPAPPPLLRVAAVVLAAGRSSRMGGANKLTESVGSVPVLARVVDAALAVGASPVVVVTGHDAPAVERAVAGRPVVVVSNPDWAEGMGTSLAVGIGRVTGAVDAAFVCLGDMPTVSADHLRALLDAFRERSDAAAWAPFHAGRRGNPVLWSARCFARLREVRGDRGGKALLDGLGSEVVEVPVADAGVLLDVDTPDALERARQHLARTEGERPGVG